MSNLVGNTYVFEASRTANQSAGFARDEASTAQVALAKAKAEAADASSRASGARLNDRAAIASLTLRLKKSEEQLAKKDAKILEKDRQVIERDRILKEWMHSNDTFKALAKAYGKKLGINDEKWVEDYNQEVVNQSEVNPDFQDTDMAKRSKAKLGL